MDGIINLYKPEGITSHDAVSAVRRQFKGTKAGHAGTLDPMASGVLPVCMGKATRITEYLLSSDKRYRCEMTLGVETDTQDIWGNLIKERETVYDTSQISDTISEFTGIIKQTPPLYSAVRVNGMRLYEYARAGMDVKRKPRNVEIYNINIISIQDGKVMMDVACSKGTYIRTLCHDIGAKLGCGAVMSYLKRTASGLFKIENTVSLEEISKIPESQFLLPMDYPLDFMGKVDLNSKDSFLKALNGCILNRDDFIIKKQKKNDLYRIYFNEKFIALGNFNEANQTIKLKKVFKEQ